MTNKSEFSTFVNSIVKPSLNIDEIGKNDIIEDINNPNSKHILVLRYNNIDHAVNFAKNDSGSFEIKDIDNNQNDSQIENFNKRIKSYLSQNNSKNLNKDFTNDLELTKEELIPIAKQTKEGILKLSSSLKPIIDNPDVTVLITIGKLMESKTGNSKLKKFKEQEKQSTNRSFQIIVTLDGKVKDNTLIDTILKDIKNNFKNSPESIKLEYNNKIKHNVNFILGDGNIDNFIYTLDCTDYKVLDEKSGYLVITVTKTLGKQPLKNAYDAVTNSQIYKDAHSALDRAYNALGKVNMG